MSKEVKFELKSFDETWKEMKDKEGNKNLVFAKKEAEVSSCMKQAYVDYLDAQSNVKKAIVEESSDIPSAVKTLEGKQRTYEFYKTIYESLFPNV